MRLAPQIQAFFEAAPKELLDFLTVQEQRQLIRHLSDLNYLRFGRRAEPVAAVADLMVPVDGGQITVRAYRPSNQAPLPAPIELHGGGWWLGSIDEHVNEAICRYWCVHAHCVVLAVEYRLAPEHPFPTAVDDLDFRSFEGNAVTVRRGRPTGSRRDVAVGECAGYPGRS